MWQMGNTGHYDPEGSLLFRERERESCDRWRLFDVRVCIKSRLGVGSAFNHKGPAKA